MEALLRFCVQGVAPEIVEIDRWGRIAQTYGTLITESMFISVIVQTSVFVFSLLA